MPPKCESFRSCDACREALRSRRACKRRVRCWIVSHSRGYIRISFGPSCSGSPGMVDASSFGTGEQLTSSSNELSFPAWVIRLTLFRQLGLPKCFHVPYDTHRCCSLSQVSSSVQGKYSARLRPRPSSDWHCRSCCGAGKIDD